MTAAHKNIKPERTAEMENFKIIKLTEHPHWKQEAAQWFHSKWGIPMNAYLESMEECLAGGFAVPQWYLVTDGAQIIAGAGVIKNDFHDRKDLTPNVCAVYVEEACRRQGIAGSLLDFICRDFLAKGIDTLYLVTDHTSFYERYGWEFLCMVWGDGEPDMTRMYRHRASLATALDESEAPTRRPAEYHDSPSGRTVP